MDLKALGQVANQLSQSSHQQSDRLLQEAYELLEQSLSLAEPFEPELMQQAAEKAIKSLSLNSRSVAGHVLMAHIMMLAEELAGAEFYVLGAQGLDPANPFVQLLVSQLQVFKELKKHQGAEPLPEQHLLALDDLYAQVEQQLRVQLAAFMHQYHPGQLSLDPEAIAALEQQFHSVTQFCAQTEASLERLESQWDTQDLHKQFAVFLRLRQQMAKQLSLTQAYDKAYQTLQHLDGQTLMLEDAIESGTMPPAQAEAALEPLLDQVDLIADELDAYENAGHDISLLATPYSSLVEAIRRIQNSLDNY